MRHVTFWLESLHILLRHHCRHLRMDDASILRSQKMTDGSTDEIRQNSRALQKRAREKIWKPARNICHSDIKFIIYATFATTSHCAQRAHHPKNKQPVNNATPSLLVVTMAASKTPFFGWYVLANLSNQRQKLAQGNGH